MLKNELIELIKQIKNNKCEGQHLEIKSASKGCPKIIETISSFSNQTNGGIIVFGIDETNDFNIVGVYNPQDLLHKITDQCNQMEPIVRGETTEVNYESKVIISLEIPEAIESDKPVFYTGAGITKGSYARIGDADERMTDFEIYNYKSYRLHEKNDIRQAPKESEKYTNNTKIGRYIEDLKKNKPNLAKFKQNQIKELAGLTNESFPTITNVLCFNKVPQCFYPQLCVTAVSVPGFKMSDTDINGNRFLDSEKIDGTIDEMLKKSIDFITKNMRKTVRFVNGQRVETTEYPIIALREALINALAHRDYSIRSEGMPIRIEMYNDRIEITNPGGLYGSSDIEGLGKANFETRNKFLVSTLESMKIIENRYSGIPTINESLKQNNLPKPIFVNSRGMFKVIFYNNLMQNQFNNENDTNIKLIEFCKIPRTRKQISEFLQISQDYAISKYVKPLISKGKLIYLKGPTKSKFQKIVSTISS